MLGGGRVRRDDCFEQVLLQIAHAYHHLSDTRGGFRASQRAIYTTDNITTQQLRRLASFMYHADQRTHTLSLLVPLLRGHGELFRAVHAPARPILFRGAEVLLPDLHFQDFCHLGSKLRVRLCGRRAHGVILGSGRASIFLLLQEMNSAVWRLMMVGAR